MEYLGKPLRNLWNEDYFELMSLGLRQFFFPKDNILYIHDALVFVVAGKVRLTIQIISEIH